MDWMEKKNVLIVGLGLMGGSYARALKRLGFHVSALDRDAEAIAYALREHIIHEGSAEDNDDLIRRADAIIFALYPGIFPEWVQSHQHLFKPGFRLVQRAGYAHQPDGIPPPKRLGLQHVHVDFFSHL